VAHGGRRSMRITNMTNSPVAARVGLSQPIDGRLVAGKQVKLTAWFKADSLEEDLYPLLAWVTPDGSDREPSIQRLHGTFDWTETTVIANVPEQAVHLWVWLMLSAPTRGRLWMDDAKLTVLGPVPKRR